MAERGIALMGLALVLAGCGQKGPLYLPESTTGEVVTRPTQTPSAPPEDAATSPSSPQSVDSPSTPASPAPEVTEPAPESERDKQKKDGAQAPSR